MPIVIDETTCRTGCTICDVYCPGDIIHREAPDQPPLVKYQEECWYCGICADNCPDNSISVVFPPEMINCQTDMMTLLGIPAQELSKRR